MAKENEQARKPEQTPSTQEESGSSNIISTISMEGYTLLYKNRASSHPTYGIQLHLDKGVVILWCEKEDEARELLDALAATTPELEERKHAYK